MKILLSIKPEYVYKILNGSKKWEYRKKLPSKNVSSMVIYSSYPEKKIVAEVEVLETIKCNVESLWKNTNAEIEGGISKEKFFKYFKDKKEGCAYKFGEVVPLYNKVLKDYGMFFPPENFRYITADPKQKEYKDICEGINNGFSNGKYNFDFLKFYSFLLNRNLSKDEMIDALCNYAGTFNIYKKF